jgi:hypothetical protein
MKTKLAKPSIIMAGFGKFNKRFDKFKEEAEKNGIVIRELKFFDVQIPIDKDYDKAVNWLKPNITPILKQYLAQKINLPFLDIDKILEKKMNLKRFDYETFEKETKPSNLYPFGYLGLTPLFVDSKYFKMLEVFENKKELENYKKLFSLSSKGYKPLKTPTAEDRYFKQHEVNDEN